MEFVRICVLDSLDTPVCFMDNRKIGALHYWDDTLHIYLKGSASTFTFSCDVTHPDSVNLTVGARIAFVKDDTPYYFTITSTEQTETELTVTCYATALGLINTYVGELLSPGLHTIEWYIKYFDTFGFIKIGANEISSKQLEIEYTNDETLLARMFDLAEEFDVEIAFEPTLNNNYSLKNIVVNIYRSHNADKGAQGIGTRRTDKVIRYGKDIGSIRKTADISELYTAILPYGKDDSVNLYSMIETVVTDAEGAIEFRKPAQSKYIYAVQAKDRFPSSILAQGTERYISQEFSYTTGSQETLYSKALAELKKKCVPKLEYTIDGPMDCNIGDTFTIQDEEFNPKLYLEARVTEIERSFTNPANGSVVIDNFKEFKSQIAANIIAKMTELSNTIREAAEEAKQEAENASTTAGEANQTATDIFNEIHDDEGLKDQLDEIIKRNESVEELLDKTTTELESVKIEYRQLLDRYQAIATELRAMNDVLKQYQHHIIIDETNGTIMIQSLNDEGQSAYKMTLRSSYIAFDSLVDAQSYFSQQELKAPSADIERLFSIGNYTFKIKSDGHLILV